MSTRINPEHVLRIVEKHRGKRGWIISILDDLQSDYNYLHKDALKIVAHRTGSSLVDLYGIATFYSFFSLEPRGEHVASVCTGTACHVRGAPDVLEAFEDTLDLKPGETSSDRKFTLNTVNCLGACALGPVAVIDGEYHRDVKTSEVDDIIEKCDLEFDPSDVESMFQINCSCPHCNRSLVTYDHLLDGQYPMIHVTVLHGHRHGWLRLSSLYGDYRIESEHVIPHDDVVKYFCPRCHGELRSTRDCPRCDASMVPLLVRAGGVVLICSRSGCKEHLLDLSR